MEESVDKPRNPEVEEQLAVMRLTLEEKEREIKSLQESKRHMEDHLSKMRSALEHKEHDLQNANKRLQEMHAHNMQLMSKRDVEDQLSGMRSVLEHKEHEVENANKRLQEVHAHYSQNMQLMSSALEQKTKELDSYKQRAKGEQKTYEVERLQYKMMEMEKNYQEKLQEKRLALHQKEEQLKSFKDRVAGDLTLSIKTGQTESMNNPVGKFRLKEKYEDLRLLWPKIRKSLKSGDDTPASVTALVQNIFDTTLKKMEQKKKQIDELFGINDQEGAVPQRLQEYKLSTVQYLQLSLYHHRKGGAESKNCPENPQDVMDYLVSQCTWLASLMALNNPPLQPDWENHEPGMNAWDIFPRNIRASSSSVP